MIKQIITRWPKGGMKTFEEYVNGEFSYSELYNRNDKSIYYKNSDGYWWKRKIITKSDGSCREYTIDSNNYQSVMGYNKNGYPIYHEDNDYKFMKREYDEKNRVCYEEFISGNWVKTEYDEINDLIIKTEGKKKHKQRFKPRKTYGSIIHTL